MKLLHQVRVPVAVKDPDLKTLAAQILQIPFTQIAEVRVAKRSLDARKKHAQVWVYSLEVYFEGEDPAEDSQDKPFPKIKWNHPPPLIIGTGPAGLFAAWTFLQHGIKPVVFEQGCRTHERMRKISRFWRTGELDRDSNVCNGEGGAGTFSDGKLITRIKNPLIKRVMEVLVTYGAPREILTAYNPHVGSNLIRNVIAAMSDDLIRQGATLRFQTRVEALKLLEREVVGLHLADGEDVSGTGLVLACGHSATDLMRTLHTQGVMIEPKSFAVGFRIEHPQAFINKIQLGTEKPGEDLGAAQYKFAHHWDRDDIGVYTFCMCPGGYVISSSTEAGQTVVNGMSNYHRNSPWANAAVVCTLDQARVAGNDPFKLLDLQKSIEKNAFDLSGSYRIPAQTLENFLEEKSGDIPAKSSCPSGIVPTNLSRLLPDWMTEHIAKGLMEFDRRRKGFAHPDAVLHAVESRTSSPIRMVRDPQTLESVNTQGLFPAGEGPGYAGGITSAAVDGIRCALGWIGKFVRNS